MRWKRVSLVAEAAQYRPSFSDLAARVCFVASEATAKNGYGSGVELARYPFLESDYRLADTDGRMVDHLLVDGILYSYWVDHISRLVMIVEIESAE